MDFATVSCWIQPGVGRCVVSPDVRLKELTKGLPILLDGASVLLASGRGVAVVEGHRKEGGQAEQGRRTVKLQFKVGGGCGDCVVLRFAGTKRCRS